jgi:hypothetical protein
LYADLLSSMLQDEESDWTWVRCVLVHPRGNPSYRRAAERYRAWLTDTSTFEVKTLEELVSSAACPDSARAAFQERDVEVG